jgi:hypothetical protein
MGGVPATGLLPKADFRLEVRWRRFGVAASNSRPRRSSPGHRRSVAGRSPRSGPPRPMLRRQLVHRSATRWSPDVARRSRARPDGDVTAGEREPGGNPGLSRSGMQERPPSPGTEFSGAGSFATREATASRSAIGEHPGVCRFPGRCPRVRRPASRAGYAVPGGHRLVDWACGSPADVSGSSPGYHRHVAGLRLPVRRWLLVLGNGETS